MSKIVPRGRPIRQLEQDAVGDLQRRCDYDEILI
jgi:hypothetical protein